MTIHSVSPGETLTAIAAGYGVDPLRLAADNGVPPGGALAVGQALVIRLPRRVHIVRSGETLYTIAMAYGTSVRKLWRNNWSLGGSTDLRPGQALVIAYDDSPVGAAVFNGYAYPSIDRDLLAAEAPYLTCLSPFTCGVSAAGHLIPLADDGLLSIARQRETAPVLHLSTLTESGQFDTARGALVLEDPDIQARLIDQVLQAVRLRGYAGVDVDFEYLPADLAGAYALFLSRLRRRLAAQGRFLWAALAPKTRREQPGLLYEGHDYLAVAAATDGVLLMTYEWGYTAGPPMAVAPLPQVRQVLEYALTEMSPGRALLGLANYGYDWPLPFVRGTTRARSVSNREAVALAIQYNVPIQFDETAQSPFFRYTDRTGTEHEVWFEDARSQAAKLRLIAEYGLQGCGIWNIDRPSPQTWQVISALYDVL